MAVTHGNSTDAIDVTWEGQLSVATTTYLQIWNRTQGRWDVMASNTAPTPTPTSPLHPQRRTSPRTTAPTNEYRIRVVTATTTRATTLKTDMFGNHSGSIAISSSANQTFALNYPTTTISEITVTEGGTPVITSANDIRIKIATTTVRMLFDTTDTTATFGGSASGKVSQTVSYAQGGSSLVIDVTSNFSASDTLTISGLSFAQFSGTNTASVALGVYTDGSGDIVANETDDKTVTITGSLTMANHTGGTSE